MSQFDRTPLTTDEHRADAGRTETLATTPDYARAQELVDTLSDKGFPVEHTAIVGSDLRMVEDVTGRKRYGRAALEGAGSGAMTGLLIGLFLSIFTLWETVASWFGVLVTWTVLGAVVGALLGMLLHAMQRGRRDFSSTARVVPSRYEVTVTAQHAEEARRLVDGSLTGAGPTDRTTVDPGDTTGTTAPPRGTADTTR